MSEPQTVQVQAREKKMLLIVTKFIFLYEDFEGDRMLVGDVPWELFLAYAKRLYIVRNPAPSDKGQGEGDRKYKTEEPTNDWHSSSKWSQGHEHICTISLHIS
ncbi:unnamed protein product [Miscanthus lutarioriparius]|uniref:Auxin-responsive protein n=1 Tax=Miscanthus lutarioriparius TaxID=422564 RepID=A0A811QA28_9POAL|nr:unnamed protein product [Miscanthus lutarioriparius]